MFLRQVRVTLYKESGSNENISQSKYFYWGGAIFDRLWAICYANSIANSICNSHIHCNNHSPPQHTATSAHYTAR